MFVNRFVIPLIVAISALMVYWLLIDPLFKRNITPHPQSPPVVKEEPPLRPQAPPQRPVPAPAAKAPPAAVPKPTPTPKTDSQPTSKDYFDKALVAKNDVQVVIAKLLMESFEHLEKGRYDQAQEILEVVLQKDPGNPLALNNLAAIMIKRKKIDEAETYLNQALRRAKGYMVQVNRVCPVGPLVAFKPASGGTGIQELEPLIRMNIDSLKQ